ncbi:MAG: dihydroorotase [Acidiferrobacter sp.]
MNIVITGGRVIDPYQGLDRVCSVFIKQGMIVGFEPPPGFTADRTIDADKLIVCPGLIDLRARLREPGLEHKATLESETRAAAAGGITTLCCPPDTNPVIDSAAIAEWLIERTSRLGAACVLPIGALTRGLAGTHLADMHALRVAGCIGVGNAYMAIKDTAILRHALEYAAGLDLLVFLTPEDPWLGAQGIMHEGRISTRLGLSGIPTSAETIALSRDLILIEQTGVRAHFCGLSTAPGLALIAAAKNQGLPVTADTPIHQLYLTEDDIGFFDSNCHLRPPLRTIQDRDALRKAFAEGVLDAVCSDHQPHEEDAKRVPFSDSEPGIAGLETLLPLTLRLVDTGLLPLADALAGLTSRPAAILGIPHGTLAPGRSADICIFDPHAEWIPEPSNAYTRGRNSPFFGTSVRGQVVVTIKSGKICYEKSPSSKDIKRVRAPG